jgi:hypothetical protein
MIFQDLPLPPVYVQYIEYIEYANPEKFELHFIYRAALYPLSPAPPLQN